MKQRPFTILFVVINISFVFLQIYKYSCWANALYRRQGCDAKKKELLIQKNMLLRKRCMLKAPNEIKQYAKQKLNMERVRISQVKILQDLHG